MTIDVVDNDDGTFTVSCGGESKTVGTPREPRPVVMRSNTIPLVVAQPSPWIEYPDDPIVENPAILAEATKRRYAPFTTIHLLAGTTGELEKMLRADIAPQANAQTPVDVSVTWGGTEAPDRRRLTRTLKTFEPGAFTAFHIHTGLTKLVR